MTTGPITLTVGWIGRHTPPGAGVDGRDAALIDIAQDLLLRDLHERGSLAALVFKGGTSLRKLYAGNQGRFSLDLDFSLADPTSDADNVVLQLVDDIDGTTIGPFTYGVTERRGKWSLTIQSPFGTEESTLSSKLVADLGERPTRTQLLAAHEAALTDPQPQRHTPVRQVLQPALGRSFTRDDMTPHEGQPPSLAMLSTRTRRPPSGSSVTFKTLNPGSANSNVVRSIMARGSLQLAALGTNSMSRPRASNPAPPRSSVKSR